MTEDLKNALCMRYCRYYKPGKAEDLACMGYTVADRLAEEGIDLCLSDGRQPSVAMQGREVRDVLVQSICRSCPFSPLDCDFMALRRGEPVGAPEEAVPCGGFLFLGDLLAIGHILDEDVKRVISQPIS